MESLAKWPKVFNFLLRTNCLFTDELTAYRQTIRLQTKSPLRKFHEQTDMHRVMYFWGAPPAQKQFCLGLLIAKKTERWGQMRTKRLVRKKWMYILKWGLRLWQQPVTLFCLIFIYVAWGKIIPSQHQIKKDIFKYRRSRRSWCFFGSRPGALNCSKW